MYVMYFFSYVYNIKIKNKVPYNFSVNFDFELLCFIELKTGRIEMTMKKRKKKP